MDMVDLLFKWVMFLIRFFICSKKWILFLFQYYLNLAIIWYLKLILLYFLAHIPSTLVIYHFWLSVPVFSMVYRKRNLVVVSSETHIHLVEILFHLSISLPPWRFLIRSSNYWTQHFLWIWDQGQCQPWVTCLTPTTLFSSLGSVPDCTRSWIQFPPLCWSHVYPNSWCWKTHYQ